MTTYAKFENTSPFADHHGTFVPANDIWRRDLQHRPYLQLIHLRFCNG
jgi:hypothetical protein